MEFERLRSSGVRFQLVINVTPVLAEQLADEYVKSEFERYILRKIRATEGDLKSGKYDEEAVKASLDHFRKVYDYWKAINGDIIGKFREFQDAGYIEIITSAATHGYLPLLGRDEAIRAQLANGGWPPTRSTSGEGLAGYGYRSAPTGPPANGSFPMAERLNGRGG